ncbi:hypothetical protein [Bergeyella sp. RCAD1439]|uniref:hypothetical protein n=1 Tax=Bergeyella anatis TaxID=3113737 RepID=UPI002E178E54|nr:hypothetical protein [Bergeyella sp. RCAD1439]
MEIRLLPEGLYALTKNNGLKKLKTLVLLLMGVFVYGQTSVKLSVLEDATGKPVAVAICQIKKNNRIVAYGNTDASGGLQLSLETAELGDYTVKVTKSGYEPVEKPVTSAFMEIKMKPKTTEIKEVVIKNTQIFKVKKDTISFNIEALKDGNERKLKDLIQKMPGLEIEEGKVKYKGQSVGNVLVEGQEFFGQRHQMATDNIEASAIKGLDLIENYTADDGTVRSALNVKLKDGYKNKWVGNLEAGGGLEKRYLGHNNSFLFKKNGNIALITDVNTIAKAPISVMDYLEFKEGNKISKEGTYSFQLPGFLEDNSSVKDKQNQFVAFQVNQKWGKLRFKSYSLLNFSQQEKFNFAEKVFFLDTGNVQTSEFDKDHGNDFFLHTKNTLHYPFGNDHFIYYDFVSNPMTENSARTLSRSFPSLMTQEVTQNRKNKDFNFGQNLKYQLPVFQNTHLALEANQNRISERRFLGINSNQNLFGIGDNVLFQHSHLRSEDYRLALALEHKTEIQTYKVGAEFRRQEAALDISGNEVSIFRNYHMLSGNWKRQWGYHWQSTIDLDLVNADNRVNAKDFRFFRLEPKVSVVYQANNLGKFAAGSSLGHRQHSVWELFPEVNIIDYQQIRSSSIEWRSYVKILNINLNYSKFNPANGSAWFVGYHFNKDINPASTDVINQLLWQNTSQIVANDAQKHSYFLTYDFRFKTLPLLVKTKTNGAFSAFSNCINQKDNVSQTATVQWSQNVFSRFKNPLFQFELGYLLNWVSFRQSFNGSHTKQFNYHLTLKVKGNAEERWYWNVGFDYISQSALENRNNLFTVNPEIRFKPRQSNFEISLLGNNIFNLKERKLLLSSQSPYASQMTYISGFPGYLAMVFKYSY